MQQFNTYHIDPFWDDSFKRLDYFYEPFNDQKSVDKWLQMGFSPKICGEMCDMRKPQPTWNTQIISYFKNLGWQDIGTSYYRMSPGTVMPEHSDLFTRYVNLFNLHGKEYNIWRAVVLLEDWKPGHYLDCMGTPFVSWRAGDVVSWSYDTPHSAANVGLVDRYTLQVTGHV